MAPSRPSFAQSFENRAWWSPKIAGQRTRPQNPDARNGAQAREFPGTSACEVAALERVHRSPGNHLTGQEKVIVRVLGQRPQGWKREALLDELSKGRREPFTSMALAVHLCHLRKKGYSVKCRDIYTLDDAPCLVLRRKGRASAFPVNETPRILREA